MNPPPDPSRHSRDFARIVTWASALSIGLVAATVASIRQVNPTVEFKFSIITVVAFLGVGIFTAAIFRRILRPADSSAPGEGKSRTRQLAVFLIVSVLAMVAAFAIALKDVSRETKIDVISGAGLAFLVLTALGWLAWRAVRFLETDDRDGK